MITCFLIFLHGSHLITRNGMIQHRHCSCTYLSKLFYFQKVILLITEEFYRNSFDHAHPPPTYLPHPLLLPIHPTSSSLPPHSALSQSNHFCFYFQSCIHYNILTLLEYDYFMALRLFSLWQLPVQFFQSVKDIFYEMVN